MSSNPRNPEPKREKPQRAESRHDDDYEMENNTTCDYSDDWMATPPFVQVTFILIFILGLSGNSVVLLTVWRARAKWRAATIYIGNLALADLAYIIIMPVLVAYFIMGGQWRLGLFMCKMTNFMFPFSVLTSAFLLTCMSFDRYRAIVRSPSSTRPRTRRHTRASLAAAWTLSGLLSLPNFVFFTTWQHPASNQTLCIPDYSLVASSFQQMRLWYAGFSLMLSTVGFLLPFLVMMVCYGLIGYTVMRHFNIRHKGDKRKWRLLRIITIVVVVFTACCMPYYVYRVIGALYDLDLLPFSCAFEHFMSLTFPYVFTLASVNSCLNPFLYAFFDRRFRSQCLGLFCLKKFRQTSTKL
ncbi:apelin receptor B-like isoform X2 [Festucalex cinctus]